MVTAVAWVLAALAGLGYWLRGRGRLPWLRLAAMLVTLALWAAMVSLPPSIAPGLPWWGGCALALVNAAAGLLLVTGSPLTWLAGTDGYGPVSQHPLARLGRFLAYPLVAAMLNTGLLIWAFDSGWYDRSRDGGWSWLLLLVVVLAFGALSFAALFSRRLLPEAGSGTRVLLGLGVVIIAQAPGLVVLLNHDQMVGGALWLVAQPVVFPMVFLLVRQWMLDDQRRARAIDAELDEWDRMRREGLLNR